MVSKRIEHMQLSGNETRTTAPRIRFGLRTLLYLPVLTACIVWWTTWPTRTAERFVQLLNEGDGKEARGMLATNFWGASRQHVGGIKDFPHKTGWNWHVEKGGFYDPIFQPRSLVDLLVGRVDFGIQSRTNQGSFLSQDGRTFYRNLQARNNRIHYTSVPLRQPLLVPIPLRHISPQSALEALTGERPAFLPENAMELGVIDGELIFIGAQQDSQAILELLNDIDRPPEP